MANALSTAMGNARKKPIRIKPSHRGSLHRALGIPQDQSIPQGKLAAAARSSSPGLRKKAVFARNAASWG